VSFDSFFSLSLLPLKHATDNVTLGFHASTEEEYAAAFAEALDLSTEEKVAMRLRARQSARRFTEEVFAGKWLSQMETLVNLQMQLSPHRTG
jgi:alpha-1,2-mannosyltransferase